MFHEPYQGDGRSLAWSGAVIGSLVVPMWVSSFLVPYLCSESVNHEGVVTSTIIALSFPLYMAWLNGVVVFRTFFKGASWFRTRQAAYIGARPVHLLQAVVMVTLVHLLMLGCATGACLSALRKLKQTVGPRKILGGAKLPPEHAVQSSIISMAS